MECSVSQWTSSPRRHKADTVRRNMWTARRTGTGRKTWSLFINIIIIIINSFLGHWLSFLWVHISPQFYINRVLFCEHSETHLVTLMISFTEHWGHFREKVNWIEINCSYKETHDGEYFWGCMIQILKCKLSFNLQMSKRGWCTEISHLKSSLNPQILPRLLGICRNLRWTIQKPLCHHWAVFAILTRTYEAPAETHSERQAHESLYKEPL